MKNKVKIIVLLTAVISIFIHATIANHSKTNRDARFKNILVLGNSITRHGPSPKIGWYGDWGMAASSREKDFVHILEKKFQELDKPARVNFESIAGFERSYWQFDFSKLDSLRSLHPDLIVLRIGENVDVKMLEKYNFETYYQSLINYFMSSSPRPQILCVSSFWRRDAVDTLIENAAKKENCFYLKISQLSEDPGNMAIGQFENEGVARHPSDKGMAAIAGEIWKQVILVSKSITVQK